MKFSNTKGQLINRIMIFLLSTLLTFSLISCKIDPTKIPGITSSESNYSYTEISKNASGSETSMSNQSKGDNFISIFSNNPSSTSSSNSRSSKSSNSERSSSENSSSSISNNNPVDESIPLTLEAEDYYERSAGITTEKNGTYVMVNEINYDGESNDIIDESIRFQPVDLREGYRKINIRYAFLKTDFDISVDVYNTGGALITNIPLPSTGGITEFATKTMTLPTALSGKKDLTFIFRDVAANFSKVNVECISFTDPITHKINKSAITDFSLFATGKPDITKYQESAPIKISGNGDYIIENKKFYPAFDTYAITVTGHKTGKVIIRNCYFVGINGAAVDGLNPKNGKGILVKESSNVLIENNYFDCIQEYGVWCETWGSTVSNNLVVANNRFYSMQGQFYAASSWGYQSKCVQFFNINGVENKIWYNRCLNAAGFSFMCDFINVYTSSGPDLANPVKVYYNAFLGGGKYGTYNNYGAGIQIGDHTSTNDGGQYVYAKYNRLVYPGMAGMNINGGYKMAMMNNYIYSEGKMRYIDSANNLFQGVLWTAMCLYNYSKGPSRDSGHRVIDNHNYFEGYGPSGAFVNQTNPANTKIVSTYHNVEMWPLDILPYDFMK